MAHVGLRRVVERLRRGIDRGDADGDLLDRFVATRDEAAFAALVERHGPKVYAVCRRVLGHHQLAEDAYQAVFVVLAKKAHAVRPRSAVGGFLYGVARKAALEAFAVTRRRKESLVGRVPEPPARAADKVEADVLAMLDEEIANLSAAYRAAVVLCELDGVSRADAARQLGIAEGTLSSRLAAARKQLAARLTARGVTFSLGLFAALSASATAAPPLASSSTASAIAGGVMRSFMLAKLKVAATACVLAAAFAAWSLGPTATPTATAAPVPKGDVQEELIWAYQPFRNELTAYRPDGTVVKDYRLQDKRRLLGITPDGRVAFVGKAGRAAAESETEGLTVHLRKPGDEPQGVDTGLTYRANQHFRWSPDMTRVVRTQLVERPGEPPPSRWKGTFSLYDFGTRQETKLDLASNHAVAGWSPDGKWLLVVERDIEPEVSTWKRLDLASGKLHALFEGYSSLHLRLSPDGKELVGFAHLRREQNKPAELYRFNVETGAATRVEKFVTTPQDIRFVSRAYWSPDGRRLLVAMREEKGRDGDETARFVVCDLDGGNCKTIVKYPHQFLGDMYWLGPRNPVATPAKPKPAGLIWTYNADTGKLVGYAPDGTPAKDVTLTDGRRFLGLTPDGSRVLYAADGTAGLTLHLRPLGDGPAATDLGIPFKPDVDTHPFVFSRDGTKLLRSRVVPGKESARPWPQTHAVIDLKTKQETAIDGLDNCVMIGLSPDGTWALAREWAAPDPKAKKGGPPQLCKLYRVPLDGGEPKVLAELPALKYAAISPDGKRVLASGTADAAKGAGFHREAVHSLDAATGKRTQLADHPMQSDTEVCWSPDGGRLAYLWLNVKPLPNFPDSLVPDEAKLVACDADGRNPTAWAVHDYAKEPKGYTQLLGWFPEARQPIAAPPKGWKDEGLMWFRKSSSDQLIAYTPDGIEATKLEIKDGVHFRGVTPDGSKIVFRGKNGRLAGQREQKGLTIHLRDLNGETVGVDTGLPSEDLDWYVWSHDRSKAVRKHFVGQERTPRYVFALHTHALIDLATKKETKLDLPTDQRVTAEFPDQSGWLVVHDNYNRDPKLPKYRWLKLTADGKLKPLADTHSFVQLEPSPDGKTLTGVGQEHPPPSDPVRYKVYTVEVAGSIVREIATCHDALGDAVCRWSPDGKRVAGIGYLRERTWDGGTRVGDSLLMRYGAEDKNDGRLLWTGRGFDMTFLGWFPTVKPKPGPKAKSMGPRPPALAAVAGVLGGAGLR
jgi:RNA polymerase sigma factor (sigma-70 family)